MDNILAGLLRKEAMHVRAYNVCVKRNIETIAADQLKYAQTARRCIIRNFGKFSKPQLIWNNPKCMAS